MTNPDPISPIVRAVLALNRRLRSERPVGSPALSSLAILATLNRLGPLPGFRLAAEERLQPQSLTRLVASLEQQGLIERARGDRDRREKVISLTQAGRQLLADDLDARRRWLESAMTDTLTERERTVLAEAAEVMLKLAFHEPTDRS